MKQRPIKSTFCALLLLVVACGQPACAQYYSPFWMLGMGQSLLYPLTRAGMMGMPYLGGPYNANPFYSANSYFRFGGLPNTFPFTNASYGPWGYRNAGMMPGSFQSNNNPDQAVPRASDEPDNANPGANTMNSSNPYQPPPPAYAPPPQPVPSSGAAPAQPLGIYSPSANSRPGAAPPASVPPIGAPPSVSTAPNAGGISSLAPPAMSKITPPVVSPGASIPAASAPSAVAASQAAASAAVSAPSFQAGRPLAEGFINHLNGNYQGDMGKALSNPDTRSWARAMGVIGDDVQDGSHLSSDRIEVLGKLLKDNTLDPVSKLDTMRILLKKSPPPSN